VAGSAGMRDAFGHCEALVREADKDRFLASLFAPAQPRPALHVLYAFNIEVARVAEAAREPLAGEIRLQWWREVIAGERVEEARGHPVAAGLVDVITRYGLPRLLFDEMIEARRLDLAGEPLHSVTEFEDYCRRTSSTLMELAARILDPAVSAEGLGFAGPCGISLAAAGLLRAFPLHASRGHLLIPGEVLARHDVDPHDILAGRQSDGLVAALADMRAWAASQYDAARPLAAQARPAVAAAWLPAALVPRYLGALDRGRSEPFRGVDVPQWRRQWILWRAARSGRLPGP
jgi:phytoene synthase